MSERIKKKMSIHWGSGDRTDEEKRIGNDYLGCDYEESWK
jgi:hypothetical protein